MLQIPKLCITLPESPERAVSAAAHFTEAGVDGVRFVPGINGPVSGLGTAFPYEVDNPGSGFNIGQKYVGVWLSHYMLWQAVTLMNHPHVMILEDDAKFHPGWKDRVDKAIIAAPHDFDWLFVGSCCTVGHPTRHISGEVFEVKYPMCFQAYILSKKGAEYLVKTQRKVYAPIDISTIFHSFPAMKVYTMIPRAVSQFNTVISE